MQAFGSTKMRLKRVAIKAILAAAGAASGLVLPAGSDEAQASKGNRIKGTTLGVATKSPGSKVVRDHRSEGKILPPPQLTKRKGVYVHCTKSGQHTTCRPLRVRDHRGPRVVPKEDPPQKW
jgi:hypothetical protein